jgi:hypothetical protein
MFIDPILLILPLGVLLDLLLLIVAVAPPYGPGKRTWLTISGLLAIAIYIAYAISGESNSSTAARDQAALAWSIFAGAILSAFGMLFVYICSKTGSKLRRFLPKAKTVSFTTMIAQDVMKKRSAQLSMLGLLFLLLSVVNGFMWPLFGVAGLLLLDLLLVYFRQSRALYGSNALEFSEAVRYIINQQKSGSGPGHFTRVFPEVSHELQAKPDGFPERAGG